MIHIIVMRSHKITQLKEAITECNKKGKHPISLIELEQVDIAGITVVRCALITDLPPPKGLDLLTEDTLCDKKYCPKCLEKGQFYLLPPQNRSGWCTKHREEDPLRTKRKRKNS